MKSIVILLFIVAVAILGVRLGIACSNVEKLGLEVFELEVALETCKGERNEKAEVLAQCQEEGEDLKAKLACYLPPSLAVEKTVRRGDYGPWGDMTRAAPGDTIQFRVVITGVGKNVYLSDVLPLGFGEVKSLRVDGELQEGNLSQLYLFDVVGEIEITYIAQLSWSLGEVSLVNQVIVWADCLEEQTSEATVEVKPRPPSSPSGGSSRPKYDNDKEGGPGPEAP